MLNNLNGNVMVTLRKITNANDEEVTTPENTETIEPEKQVGDTIVDDDQDTNTNEDDNTIEKVEEETNTN